MTDSNVQVSQDSVISDFNCYKYSTETQSWIVHHIHYTTVDNDRLCIQYFKKQALYTVFTDTSVLTC
jgi:hypothetical protein